MPGRADARTTWSSEVPAQRPDDTIPGFEDAPAAGAPADSVWAAARRAGADLLARKPPLPGSPTPDADLDPAAATARAEELLDNLAAGDEETAGHLRRTAATVEAVATALQWDEARIRWATFGALLHDIGKIGVAPQVMRKPGPLSAPEQAAMRDHVGFGTHLVTAYGFPPLVSRIVREHHERLDGSGYPAGLRGTEICEEARLVMLADIADAMLSRRAYKQPLSLDDVRHALDAGSGLLFDPDLIGPVIAELSKDRD